MATDLDTGIDAPNHVIPYNGIVDKDDLDQRKQNSRPAYAGYVELGLAYARVNQGDLVFAKKATQRGFNPSKPVHFKGVSTLNRAGRAGDTVEDINEEFQFVGVARGSSEGDGDDDANRNFATTQGGVANTYNFGPYPIRQHARVMVTAPSLDQPIPESIGHGPGGRPDDKIHWWTIEYNPKHHKATHALLMRRLIKQADDAGASPEYQRLLSGWEDVMGDADQTRRFNLDSSKIDNAAQLYSKALGSLFVLFMNKAASLGWVNEDAIDTSSLDASSKGLSEDKLAELGRALGLVQNDSVRMVNYGNTSTTFNMFVARTAFQYGTDFKVLPGEDADLSEDASRVRDSLETACYDFCNAVTESDNYYQDRVIGTARKTAKPGTRMPIHLKSGIV